MRTSPAYISIGANRSSSCSACSSSGTLAFGAGLFVALWNTEDERGVGVHTTLPGHVGQVTTLKLLSDSPGYTTFVSGDSVGEVRIWRDGPAGYTCVLAFGAHPGHSVSALAVSPATPTQDGGALNNHVFTGGSDGAVKLWRIEGKKAEEVQRMDLRGKLPLDMEVAYLPGSQAPVLAIGCTDRRIQLWTRTNGVFSHAISLEGHEDWIRCLSFTSFPSSSSSSGADLLLASGSQDNYIRLWRVSAASSPSRPGDTAGKAEGSGADQSELSLDMLDEFERKLAGEAGGSVQISTKAHVLAVEDLSGPSRYNVTLEALLIGHEAGLTNLHWSSSASVSDSASPPLLLSTASDNSLIVWSPSSHSTSTDGIWVPSHRFGVLGGRGLAFFGAIWGRGGKTVLASGWNGGWERWVRDDDVDEVWQPKAGLTGHFGEVQSVVWDPKGDYLLSVGSDQTSRIHAACSPSAVAGPSRQQTGTPVWAEIARPQIHGYDMTDAAWLSGLRFASGADEKVTRVFDAPAGFVESLGTLGVASSKKDEVDAASRPKGATVPPLGLSNRALGKAPDQPETPGAHVPNPSHDSISRALTSLPTEEELASSTLWPEIASVAASHDGRVLATACRATTTEHAVVRLSDTSTWDHAGEPLAGHSLTVTRIAFSPDDERILTCSRDRGWRMFSKANNGPGYVPLTSEEKAHARMVLDCCWSPNGDMFATASRDKTIKIWTAATPEATQWACSATLKLTESITAVDLTLHGSMLVLAAGTESGGIVVYSISAADGAVSSKELLKIDESSSHVAAVNRLAWRQAREGRSGLQLASCSDDRSVRVFDVELDTA